MGRRKGGRKGRPDGIAEQNIAHYTKGLNDEYDKGKKEVFDDIDKTFREGSVGKLWLVDYNKLKKKHLHSPIKRGK